MKDMIQEEAIFLSLVYPTKCYYSCLSSSSISQYFPRIKELPRLRKI